MNQETAIHNAVDLVIRFTNSLPDATIPVVEPDHTSVCTLKRRIRAELPSNVAGGRLRLIAAGKVLAEESALSRAISIPPPPPQVSGGSGHDRNGKGKAPLRASLPAQSFARVYVHCSIGDALTPAELEHEERTADAADANLSLGSKHGDKTTSRQATNSAEGTAAMSGPRGFDRLLQSGFTQDDVATLRTQFMAIQAHNHTPDTMPTGDRLRALEDRWLDNDTSHGATETLDVDGTGGFGAEDGGLDDMLWGNIVGFFWPVAAVCWLMREEGVWSRRRQIAVLSGMLVNLTFGFLRLTN